MTIGRIPSVEGGIQPTIVDAKGDLIAATAADTVNRLAVGSNDQVLVADSSASTGLAWKSYGSQLSSSNPVLNSDFSIWQRGTSRAGTLGTSVGTYTADRWVVYIAAGANTVSRQATGDTTNLPNIQYCARMARDSGQTHTNTHYLINIFETSNSIPFAGKTVTLSFYARKGANYSSTSDILKAQIYTGTGTDQNVISGFTGSVVLGQTNFTLTTTWQRFSLTATIGSTVTQIASAFQRDPVGTAGAADYFEVTGVQLDVGSVAQPYRRAMNTIQGELAACQRYYYRSVVGGNESAFSTSGTGQSSTATAFFVPLPVPMRIKPSSVDFSTLAAADFNNAPVALTNLTLNSNNSNPQIAVVNGTSASGITQYRPYFLSSNNSASGYVGFSAEL